MSFRFDLGLKIKAAPKGRRKPVLTETAQVYRFQVTVTFVPMGTRG